MHSVCVCTVCNAELTESQQQMEQLASDANIHPPSTSNKKYNMPSKPSTAAGVSVHRDVCVQTEPVATVSSSSQLAVTGYPSVTVEHHYGKEYLDPSPILPHVISPDTLEGMYQISSLADYSQKKQNKTKKKKNHENLVLINSEFISILIPSETISMSALVHFNKQKLLALRARNGSIVIYLTLSWVTLNNADTPIIITSCKI